MPGRKWRLGVETTTSYDLIVRSGTSHRYRSSIGRRHAAHGDRFTPWERPAGRSSIGDRLKALPYIRLKPGHLLGAGHYHLNGPRKTA
ncbi:hypothetical protein CHELA40_11959 [Chelatococcus asaccharovorans]|nr:hypothetical protein CHELA40_11959 [Chelatococcus asaccharovorans]